MQVNWKSAYILACAATIFVVAAVFAWVPVVYDTLHVKDTLFLAEIGWRHFSGLEPGLDFRNLYGGVTSEYIALAMMLAGPVIKALDYAAVLQLLTVLLLLGIVSYRRMNLVLGMTLALLCSAVMLARAPLEEVLFISEPISAHSFIYNRFGTALMLCLAVFLIIPTSHRTLEDIVAAICGAICFVLILTKPTFFLPSLAILAGLSIQLRLRSLVFSILGFAIASMVLDPWFTRTIASLEYNFAVQGEDNTSIFALVFKAIRIGFAHQLSLAMVIALCVHQFIVGDGAARRVAISALFALAAFAGTSVTFGPAGLVGHQLLPLIAGICLALAAYRDHGAAQGRPLPSYGIAFAMVLSLMTALPHLANTVATTGLAVARAELVEIADGPMANYLARSRDFPPAIDVATQDAAGLRAEQMKAHVVGGDRKTAGSRYAMLVDGIALLERLGDVSEYGIASGSDVVFSFAVGSRALADYPVWITEGAPEFAADALPPEIDLVILSKLTDLKIGGMLRRQMGSEFSMCIESGIWSVYARQSSSIEACSRS